MVNILPTHVSNLYLSVGKLPAQLKFDKCMGILKFGPS